MTSQDDSTVPPERLREIEHVAVELANLAGVEITSALGGMLAVRYKGDEDAEQVWQDPVSEVDQRVEKLIRERLAEKFPEHDIIGEEFKDRPGRDHDFVWAVDPVDGTTNFVNGFPMFAAAIGVLYRGSPVVGALWCSTSHALRAGVYHACEDGPLRFEGDQVTPKRNEAVRRRLAGVAQVGAGRGPWETRKTGSAAVECAFVAAGLLEAARFETPNLWDIAGGVVLVQATGGTVLQRYGKGWSVLDRFEAPEAGGDLGRWKQALIVGNADEEALLAGLGD